MLRFIRSEPTVCILSVAGIALFLILSCYRYANYGTSVDLGIFDQNLAAMSHFDWPRTTLAIDNRIFFGHHFSPILIVLAPFYWIWPSAYVLLIAQALLLGAAAIPVYLFAKPRLGAIAANLFAAGYLLFWGLYSGVAYDFHEVAFAPVIIATILYAIDNKRWRMYWISIVLLLMVKEDMSFAVCAIGVYLALLRKFKFGAITFVLGIAWFYLTTKALMPALLGKDYLLWSYNHFGSDLPSAIQSFFNDPIEPFRVLISRPEKAETMVFLFLPFLFLTVYSPIFVITFPLILERMLSDNELYFFRHFHYSVAIAPVLALGAADGLKNLANYFKLTKTPRQALYITVGALVVLMNILSSDQPLNTIFDSNYRTKTAASKTVDGILDKIPPGASVMTYDNALAHLTARSKSIYPFASDTPWTEYIFYNRNNTWGNTFPSTPDDLKEMIRVRKPYYRPVVSTPDGFELLKRK